MPSDSRMRISSSLITWPLARSFFPPERKTVQHRILPVELLTSTVFALMAPHRQVELIALPRLFRRVRLYKERVGTHAKTLDIFRGYLGGRKLVYLWVITDSTYRI